MRRTICALIALMSLSCSDGSEDWTCGDYQARAGDLNNTQRGECFDAGCDVCE